MTFSLSIILMQHCYVCISLISKTQKMNILEPIAFKSVNISNNASLYILIAVNLIPILGVLFLSWSPMEVVYLYWAETVIIGFFNIFKMALAGKNGFELILLKCFMIPFFIVHFGMFTLIQGVFIMLMDPKLKTYILTGKPMPEFLVIDSLSSTLHTLFWPLLLLFASHFFSFFWNYVGKKEYVGKDPGNLMVKPYSRIIVQQLVAILGTCLILSINNGRVTIMLSIIIAKIYADIRGHKREHKPKTPANQPATSPDKVS